VIQLSLGMQTMFQKLSTGIFASGARFVETALLDRPINYLLSIAQAAGAGECIRLRLGFSPSGA